MRCGTRLFDDVPTFCVPSPKGKITTVSWVAREGRPVLWQSALGYEEVETYGFDPKGIGYYGMPAKAFARLLQDSNLTTPSPRWTEQNRPFVDTSKPAISG